MYSIKCLFVTSITVCRFFVPASVAVDADSVLVKPAIKMPFLLAPFLQYQVMFGKIPLQRLRLSLEKKIFFHFPSFKNQERSVSIYMLVIRSFHTQFFSMRTYKKKAPIHF